MKFQVRAARNLLSAVARLLILADMIDVHMLLMKLQRVEDDLEVLKSASSQAELIEGMERFGDSAHELMTQVNTYLHKTKSGSSEENLISCKSRLSLDHLTNWDDWRACKTISWGWHWSTFKNIDC